MNTYWDKTGTYQQLAEELDRLIPILGPCLDARGKSKHLDRLRRAGNCYYDLYNNGLCNRADEFRRIFGFGARAEIRAYRYTGLLVGKLTAARIEAKLDQLILAAAKEQGVTP